MARPFYPHEADDPDLDWLVTNFLYDRPNFMPVETGTLPLVLIPYVEVEERDPPRQPVHEAEEERDTD